MLGACEHACIRHMLASGTPCDVPAFLPAYHCSNAVVQSVGWHPSGQLLLTAGLDKKLRMFQVRLDGVLRCAWMECSSALVC